jgi:tRNA G18 (ribose-2'-O)-methylase SpoU
MRKLKNEELGRLDLEAFREAAKTPVTVILDNIRSAHNVGAVFRTADAFRIEKIWLCGITACPPHKDIRKTALGATESVEWEYAPDTAELVRQLSATHSVFAIEQTEGSHSLATFSPVTEMAFAFVFGHEVQGVSQEVVDACEGAIEIPQSGTKHSLNVSVAAGIVLWEVFSKRLK